MNRRPVSNFDPHDPGLAPVQHEVLTGLLEHCPVSWSERHGGFWSLTKFDDVVAAARDHATYTVEQGIMVPSLGATTPVPPAQVDPPQHTKYRSILHPFFNPKAVTGYEHLVRDLVRSTIAEFAGRGSAELSRDLAHPVPTMTIAAILGLEPAQWRHIRDLVEVYLLTANQGADAKARAAGALEAFVHAQVAARRGEPVTDLLGTIVNSEIDGKPMSDRMIVGMVHVLITAGHETTINSIGTVLCHLLTIPALVEQVRADRSLIAPLISESLRVESPVMCMGRTVLADTTVRDVTLHAADKAILVYGAANLDPDRYDEPAEFRLNRPKPHIAFGSGPHRCIGEHLAMLQMRVAIEEVLDTFPDIRVSGTPEWGSGAVSRGIRKLPVEFTPVATQHVKSDTRGTDA